MRIGCRMRHAAKSIAQTRCNQTQPPRNQKHFLLMSGKISKRLE